MTKVLITTSGKGTRLGDLTSYTNKSLVPVGDKYALARIIDCYPIDSEFIITTGYLGHFVKEFCFLCYPNLNIRFVDIDLYDGEGSSLLYSMLQASKWLQEPFFFHCCDTIIKEPLAIPHSNTLFVTKHHDAHSYASVSVNDRYVSELHNKGYLSNDYIYVGISYIVDTKEFWKQAETIYKEKKTNISLSDVDCIQQMLRDYQFQYKVLEGVQDTGNLLRYKECLKEYPSSYTILAKPNESLHFEKTFVLKFSSDKNLNKKRYERAIQIMPNCPTILGVTDHFLKMDFVKGTILSESNQHNEISSLLCWADKNLWKDFETDSSFKKTSADFYIQKTITRLSKLKLKDTSLTINGLDVEPMDTLLKKIPSDLLLTDTFCRYHGDFILDNILKKENGSYCLLDWREEFGNQIHKGDIYYDLAKLQHNIIFNHKNILSNLFTVKHNGAEVTVDLKCNYSLVSQLQQFHQFLQEKNLMKHKVDILTAIVWLNMAPLYEAPLEDFLFYFGKFHLAKSLSAIGVL
jgi:NDP-sugar pyrophosphorylase family protein/thiamine kinase-like enzyme